MVTNRLEINVAEIAKARTTGEIEEALDKMDIFFGQCLNKQLRYLLFVYCLLSCRKITSGEEARLQRRFMWKQMQMDNLVSDVATRAYAMKNMFSDLAPTAHSAVPSKLLDYLPSETTRVKYIIRNPTTKKPMKIIKLRPSKKIIKLIPKHAVTSDTKSMLTQKKAVPVPTYLSSDQMEMLEKEQELIAEGRFPHKAEDEALSHILEDEKYAQQSEQEMHEQHDGWSPVFDTDNMAASYSPNKPSAISTMSPLHTSFMAEALPKPEKQIAESPVFSIYGQEQLDNHDAQIEQNYYYPTAQPNGYEVTEHIAEESIALPLTQGSRINVRIGSPPARYALAQPTNIANRGKLAQTATVSTSTEEPPNYPPNFLRRFQERSNAAAVSPTSGTTSSATAVRTKQRKSAAELSADWIPKAGNISNTRETFKFRARFQGVPARIKSEKWPPEVENSAPTPHLAPSRFSTAENFAEIKSPVFSSTTTIATLAAESRQQTAELSIGRLRKPPLAVPAKTRQSAELPRLREMRAQNRGKIKFGDKIFTDE